MMHTTLHYLELWNDIMRIPRFRLDSIPSIHMQKKQGQQPTEKITPRQSRGSYSLQGGISVS